MSYFEEKIELGILGEDIVYEYFESKGYDVKLYGDRKNQHEIDLIVTKGNDTFLVDVKTKRCRELYPDTGFDYKDYLKYNQLSYKNNIRVFMVFVDYHLGKVYYEDLDKLDIYDGEYPYFDNRKGADKSVIYFPLSLFHDLFNLTDKEIELIRANSDEYKGY